MGHLLPCAIDFKMNHPPIHLQWIGKLGMSIEPRHVISMEPRQPEVPVRQLSTATSSVWRILCTWKWFPYARSSNHAASVTATARLLPGSLPHPHAENAFETQHTFHIDLHVKVWHQLRIPPAAAAKIFPWPIARNHSGQRNTKPLAIRPCGRTAAESLSKSLAGKNDGSLVVNTSEIITPTANISMIFDTLSHSVAVIAVTSRLV